MAIGCIGEEFDLDGKQLILLGPTRAERPASVGPDSGLYIDAAGMRVATAPEVVDVVAQEGPSTAIVRVAAWSSHRLPEPVVMFTNPYSDRPYMVAGHWLIQWETQTTASNRGLLSLHAEPSRYKDTAPEAAFGFRHGKLPAAQQWGGTGVWPVCEVLAPGEALTLYANASLVNGSPVEAQLIYRNVQFSGVHGPAASGHPIPTLAQIVTRESGKTLGQIAAAHTGKTLAQMVDEWSR